VRALAFLALLDHFMLFSPFTLVFEMNRHVFKRFMVWASGRGTILQWLGESQ
jgi:hypothetical protein